MGWYNKYHRNMLATENNLQTEYNTSENANSILLRSRKNEAKIHKRK